MTTETLENNEVTGYVCPSCRMVFSAPNELGGNGVVCPGCGVLLRISPENAVIKEIQVVENTPVPSEVTSEVSHSSRRKKHSSRSVEDEFGAQENGAQGGDFSLKLILPLLVFSCLVLGVIAYLFLRPPEVPRTLADSQGEVALDVEDKVTSPVEEKEEVYKFDKNDEAQVKRVEDFISEWHSAKTVDERMKLVRPVEGIREKMEYHYKSFPSPNSKLKTVNGISDLVTVPGYVAYSSLTEDYKRHSGLIKYSKDSLLLDWESHVSFSEMTFTELAEKKPTEPVKLRVVASVGQYYNNNFSDELKWRSIALESLNEEDVLYGYVAINSANEQRIFNFGNIDKQSLILEVFYLPNEESGNQVMINKVVQHGWLEQ